ncbi:transposase [Streptomyces sp. NPDC097610]|uniref:transposase n=1 Tax=Streptomyces sp. NPDC097610 TaxID=3157227 RepID=UPI00332C4049
MEEYAARFDDLFFSLAQWRGFREYLIGLLAPRERNKTITCLAGAEPVAGAGMPGVQRLQFFLSESPWEVERVNDRRLELLREQPATAPHEGGVIVIDDSCAYSVSDDWYLALRGAGLPLRFPRCLGVTDQLVRRG